MDVSYNLLEVIEDVIFNQQANCIELNFRNNMMCHFLTYYGPSTTTLEIWGIIEGYAKTAIFQNLSFSVFTNLSNWIRWYGTIFRHVHTAISLQWYAPWCYHNSASSIPNLIERGRYTRPTAMKWQLEMSSTSCSSTQNMHGKGGNVSTTIPSL